MYKKLVSLAALSATVLLSGCLAGTVMKEADPNFALKTPSAGKAGVYVLRGFGDNVGRDVWINGSCAAKIGEYHYVYQEIDAGKQHVISTKGMLGHKHTKIVAQAGQLYFFEQIGAGSSSYSSTLHSRTKLRTHAIKVLSKSTWVANQRCNPQNIRIS